MKIYKEDNQIIPAIIIQADSDPAPVGFTEDTTIANFYIYGVGEGLTVAQVVCQIIPLIPDWATYPQADKDKLIAFANWTPPHISLGGGFVNGTTVALNTGAGVYINFNSGANDEYLFNIALENDGIPYCGSEIMPDIYFMKFGVGSGTVIWEIDYCFSSIGDDAYVKSDGMISETVSVGGLANQTLTETTFSPISGNAGAKVLQMTIRRKSTGDGKDTYTGEAKAYGFNLINK